MKKKEKKKTAFIKKHPQTFGLMVFLLSFLTLLSLISFKMDHPDANFLGTLGYLLGYLFTYFFGLGAVLVPLFSGFFSIFYIRNKPFKHPVSKWLHFSYGLVAACLSFNTASDFAPQMAKFFEERVLSDSIILDHFYPLVHTRYFLGGIPFYFLLKEMPFFNLLQIFSHLGTFVLTSFFMLVSLANIVEFRPTQLIKWMFSRPKKPKEVGFFSELFRIFNNRKEKISKVKNLPDLEKRLEKAWTTSKPKKIESEKEPPIYTKTKREIAIKVQKVFNGDFSGYILPSSSLLRDPVPQDMSTLKKDLLYLGKILEQTLESFGITANVGSIHYGPRIASFEVMPSSGTKVQKIKALENDIALNLKAKSTRIIAPIPGKAAVGIEIPNPQPHEVNFKELLENYQASSKKHHIPILLGKSVIGEDITTDLSRMPHCLIAGATGSGKSVCMNTIILSILMNARPDEVKLLMVDPKKVELTGYTALPHMIAPVITESHGAQAALNWLVKEMQLRYEILKQLGQRNILGFNARKRDVKKEEELSIDIPEKMPYIVAIIDEFADLMMAAQTDIETPIARIAQMARAVGIHMILATQRPSREVITGLIKANFPTRISFKVASKINSQIILDETGAERLLGNGDMLFLPPGSSHTLRVQGSYLSDEEIHQVIEAITAQSPTNYLIESFDHMGSQNFDNEAPRDSLFDLAKQTVVDTGNASTTFLQRKLKIGYARAASLMDELEDRGIVTAQDGSKPRRVLYND
ncbi:MAG: DNA translocase FtsK [Chlamydiae bacterium]|nr:DNA translocase FtsK [Chlamydiota bacterium]